ncbi:MAG: CinA family protein [candidate division WOR-3 bacterium]
MKNLALLIGKRLLKKNLTLSVSESCTGGMLGSIITAIPGSSNYFRGGIIAYSNEIKNRIIGVKPFTLKKFGAVSKQTAQEMAQGVRRITKSDISISITGIAGPGGGTKTKPVGLVYIAVADRKNTVANRFVFTGNREQVRKKACFNALKMLLDFIRGMK